MKKFLPSIAKAFALVAFATIISCGDDDSKDTNNADKIVGSWVYNGYTDSATGEYFPDDQDPCVSFTMTFKANGEGNDIDHDCENGDDTSNFTWKTQGSGTYVVTDEDGDPDIMAVEFVGDKQMNIIWEDSDVEKFTRK